jgi:hypothetical protein
MSATATDLLTFVRDMERQQVSPFKYEDKRLWALGCSMREAALADDVVSVAEHIRVTRLERLWRIENWLMFREQRHPKIEAWLHTLLVEIGWRRPLQNSGVVS